MTPFLNYLDAARMFHSRNIDELSDALGEDDDGPDGGVQHHAQPPKTDRPELRPCS